VRSIHLPLMALIGVMLFSVSLIARADGPEIPNATLKAIEDAKAQKKPVALLFTADWCPPCKAMKKEALTDKSVLELLDKTVFLKVDFTGEPDADGRKLAEQHKVEGIPHMVFINAKGEVQPKLTMSGYGGVEPLKRSLQQLTADIKPAPKPAVTSQPTSKPKPRTTKPSATRKAPRK